MSSALNGFKIYTEGLKELEMYGMLGNCRVYCNKYGRAKMTKTAYLVLTSLAFLSSLSAQANVIGTGAQNFNTITSGLDFVTVHSSETLKPGILNFGVFFNYAVNSLPYFEDLPQGRTEFNDTLLGADFNFGLGLLQDWDIGISFPYVLSQTVTANTTYRGEFSKNGQTEVRVNSKVHLWGDDKQGLAVIGTINFNRIINNPYKGDPANPTYNLEFAYDRNIKRVNLALNLGHRWTLPGAAISGSPIEPLRNQWIASFGSSYLIPNVDTKLIAEIFSSIPTVNLSSDNDRSNSSLEIIGGVKHDFSQNLAGHFGGGTELLHGISSPDWRIYTGINFTFGPIYLADEKHYEIVRHKKVLRLVVGNILFGYDSDKMEGNYRELLDSVTQYLKEGPQYAKLVVEGHTDSIGSADYNQRLSERRALAIVKELTSYYKISKSKVQAKGMGEEFPIADNGNYQGRTKNRRVEFRVLR